MRMLALLLLLSVFTGAAANEYMLIIFGNDYLPDTVFIAESEKPCFRQDLFRNAGFVFLMDEFLNSGIYTGPDDWDHNEKTLSFLSGPDFITDPEFSFADFFGTKDSISVHAIDIRAHTADFAILHSLRNMYSSVKNGDFSTPFPEILAAADTDSVFSGIYAYHLMTKNKDYYSALLLSRDMLSKKPDDRILFRYYALSLMNNGMFGEAMTSIGKFYKDIVPDDLYYSLMMNLYAITGKFDKSEEYLIEGRNLYPESKTLIIDGLNLYSVIDSSIYAEYIELMNITEQE